MTDRKALLIGVSSYDNDVFPAIGDVVSVDVRRMAEALSQSGYEIQYCGVGDPTGREPTGNRIRAAILAALREASAGSVLVVYFSGHGVVVNGHSWLVPQDVYDVGNGPEAESLVSLVPPNVGGCSARLVLFLVDACRNDLSESLARPPGGGTLPYPPDGAFVLINSCQPGERSQHGDDGSYFTQALAEVLDRRYSARTLDEVHAAVVRQMARKAASTDGLAQRPDLAYAERGMTRVEFGALVLCDGDRVGEAWRRAVESSPLWERGGITPIDVDRVRRAVLGVVDNCAQQWLDARAVLKSVAGLDDVWSAQDYPVRVLTTLVQCLPPDIELTPLELGAAISVPFLREVALSAGIRLAAGLRPHDFSRTFQDGPRSDLEITHAMHEHVCRRAEGLGRRRQIQSRDALAMWLVHRWLAERVSLWTDPTVMQLTARITATIAPVTADATEREMSDILGVLMQCVDAGADDQRLVDRLAAHVVNDRLRALGAALWIAGVMAADPRRMPSVVVDHVGIGAELPVARLHVATVQATWRRSDAGLVLQAVCEHPALQAAFSDLTQRANDALNKLRTVGLSPEMSRSLPAAFHASGVRAEIRDGSPVFDVPLLQFRLSDDKVRELLMGRQLYGEPDLAIRELYQNALDACRYRRTRREFRRRTGQPITAWEGNIVLTQGVDEVGREYIECLDNGVGMSHEILMSTFANAGERFVYRSSFRAEQTSWQELNPPLQLIPNSQFGVGVFSYFMVAEEILIATRPIGVDDVVEANAHTVRIASSGSLFQISTSTDMPGGGTRVRLYLTGEDRISVLQTMRRLLWLAEFEVSVSEQGGSGEVWRPEQLRFPGATVEPLKFGADIWWVPGEGGLMADGIRTNEERFGLVVNLRGPRRPQFTVDRNRLRSWDKEWISRQIRDSLAGLQEWPGLTMGWLWRVAEQNASVAEEVFGWLVDHDREMPVERSWIHSTRPSAAQVGCLPVDQELLGGDMYWSTYDGSNMWLVCWRVGAWKGVLTFIQVEKVPEVVCLEGFPVARPLDAAIIDKIYESGQSYRSPAQYGKPSVYDLLDVAPDDDESPVTRFRRLRRFAITGLDLRALRELPPVHHLFKYGPLDDGVENPNLLSALGAWAPPDREPRQAIGGWLGRASSRLHAPLGEVLRRAREIVPPDWVGPNEMDLADLSDHIFSWSDVGVFSASLYDGPPWIPALVQPAHIIRLNAQLGRDVSDLLRLFDQFAPLGYQVAGRDLYPSELINSEHEALRHVEEMGQLFTPLHLLIIAGRVGRPVSAVRAELERLEHAGFLRLPAHDPMPEAIPTENERAIIGECLMISDAQTGYATPAVGWTAVRLLVNDIGSKDVQGFEERLDEHRRLLDIADICRPITMPEIVDLAYWLDCTVSAAIDYYADLYPYTADFSGIPAGAKISSVQCRRYEERTALISEPADIQYGFNIVRWLLGPGDIVRGAGLARQSVATYLESLEAFRSLGAPLPVLSSSERETLNSRTADRYDVSMLSLTDGSGRGNMTLTEVTPLRLIQVAGRFGWTVADTRDRFARFEPLGLTVHCPAEYCPHELVYWQDLLALTKYLDGQDPVLSGVVSADHLCAAAVHLDESTDTVRARLQRYAGLFGFAFESAISTPPESAIA